MKTKFSHRTCSLFIFVFVVYSHTESFSQKHEIPYTLEDRERSIRTEESIKSLSIRTEESIKSLSIRTEESIKSQSIITEESIKSLKQDVNHRFEAINDMISRLYTLIYFLLGGVFGLIGLIFWDRRSYVKPVKEDILQLQKALKEFAREQPKLAEILRTYGIF